MRALSRHHARLRRAGSIAGLALILGVHLAMLLPLVAIAEEAAPAPASIRATPEDDEAVRLMPGLEFLQGFKSGSGLQYFHPPAGTYAENGPSPEAVAAAIEAARIAEGGDPKYKVLKVYSIVEIEENLMFGVRYQTNQSLGIVRNMVFDEVVGVNIETGEVTAGGFMFIDPLYAAQMPDPDPTWRTAIGGIGAVAAAAAAMAAALASGGAAAGAAAGAGAAASSGGGKGDGDPNRVVGHILQLNAKKIDVTPVRPALLQATVWKVHANGSYEAAPDCEVILVMPEGYTASVERSMGSLSATISQGPKAQSPSAITVAVNGPASGTTDYVEVVGEVASKITWRLDPPDRGPLVPNARDKVALVADVQLSPSAQADPSVDLSAVRQSIQFAGQGDWAEVSSPVDWTDGGRAVNVIARSPQPDRQLAPPESIAVAISATVGQAQLSETATISCGGMPELEVKPEELEFAEGCAKTFEFDATVNNAAGTQWTFEVEWKEGSPSVGELSLLDPKPDRTTVRITERAPENPNPNRPRTVGTMVVKATAEDFDDLERHIQIVSLREGLYPDTINMSPDGSFHISADGSAKPTDIGFRVYVSDPNTGEILTDPGLVKGLEIQPNDDPGTHERNAWEFAAFEPRFTELRDTGNGPTGVYRFATDKKIPGKSDRLPLAAWVSVPGKDPEQFGYDLRLTLDTPASAPGSEAWQIEYDRCNKIIDEFTPWKYQQKLREILESRSKVLGAEGLAEMRKRIWYISADLVLAEGAEGYKAEEAWANRIYVVLDWANYAGDIAFGIVVGIYAGPYSAFAAQLLKPMMISAIIAYREGRSPEEWLHEQLYTVVGIFEGKLIDPDNFAKLTGGSKAKAWALYVSYHFFKEYFYNKKSFVEAIRSVALNVAEEVLVGWLSGKVRESGISPDATKPGETTIKAGDPAKPLDPARPIDTPRPIDPAKPVDPARPVDATKPVDPAKPADATKPHEAAPDSRKKKSATDDLDWEKEAEAWVKGADGQKPTEPAKPADPAKPTEGASGDADAGTKRDKKGPPDPDKKAPPKAKPEPMSDTARKIREATTKGPDGRKYADLETTLEIMRDPTKVRDLKNAPPDVQEAFENTRRAVYERHDVRVVDAARRALPGGYGKKIKVLEFRTPGGGGGLNTDRDFRVCYEGVDPNTGKTTWIEVPRDKWEGASHQAFSEITGGPKPADPNNPTPHEVESMRQWAESHQQLATDKGHIEASMDFTDQGYTVDPNTGAVVKTQVEPNIEKVKRGEGKLIDPDGLGRMFSEKVRDAVETKGNTAEGYAQARKGVEQLQGVRQGYEKQGYDVGELPASMRDVMAKVSDAGKNSTDPAKVQAAEQALRDNNFGSLSDFMDKVQSQYSSLGMARKR